MTTTKKTITRITNEFTGYDKTLTTKGVPAIATLKKHIRESKESGCMSVTRILTNCDDDGTSGDLVEVSKFGEVLINGRRY